MPVDIRIRFGRAIRRIREAQGINQEEAAGRCGTSMIGNSQGEAGIPLDLAEGVLPRGKAFA